MVHSLKTTLAKNITNARGWTSDRKIVVIESDDWGSIRMPNRKTLEHLSLKGFAVEKCAYLMNDTLESNDDLAVLFEFLQKRANTPVITANFLTTNPDFEKIEKSNFEEYFPESLEDTLTQYPNHSRVKDLWIEGNLNKYFVSQLHGREHLNISQWMMDLRNGNKETLEAFNHNLFGVSDNVVKVKRKSYQEAFGIRNNNFIVDYDKILTEASVDFERLFGFRSKTFIAPNYTWGEEVEKITARLGVTHLQGIASQRIPCEEENKIILKRNYLGKRNKYDQKYLVRNVSFEPFSDRKKDWVTSALNDIKNAFFWNKPAIISMHRVNFVGSINPSNREDNLILFNKLLNKIEDHWPNVEYLSSNELAKLI